MDEESTSFMGWSINVSGKDFTIIVNETDEYIDEIYKLIENCTSRGR